jgi:DNA-binding NarL/FixJ family response regulator
MRRVVVVDRPGLFLTGLCMLLASSLPEHRVVVALDLAAAEQELESNGAPDLVLIDINLPDASWTMLRSLRDRYPTTRFLVMCSTAGWTESMRALENGFDGCISKREPDDEISMAIRAVLSGRIHVPQNASDHEDERTDVQGEHAENGRLHCNLHIEKLTPRQRDILPLLAKGMSNKEIARALKIAEGTTKIHTSSLLRILGARNRTQAAVIAQRYLPFDTTVSDLRDWSAADRDTN